MPRRTQKKSKKRGRKRGGGYFFDPQRMITAGSLEVNRYTGAGTDCPKMPMDGARPMLPGGLTGGLPMSGGYRNRKNQAGGRYGFDVSSAGSYFPQNAVGMSGYAPVQHVRCEGGAPNSLNMRPMSGGAAPLGSAPLTMTVGGTGSQALYSSNAGYMNRMSMSGGVPLMTQTPYPAGGFNPACMKTAGGSRKRRAKKTKRARRHH